MRYQIIEANNRIVNSSQFGRRLRRFLRRTEQKALLPKGATWRRDGAWILADALVHWSGRCLAMSSLCRPDGQIDHIVAADPIGRIFIDADGVAGEIDLMTKMALVMHSPNVTLAAFSAETAARKGILYQEEVAIELAMRILHRFGSYRPSLFEPTKRPASVDAARNSLRAVAFAVSPCGRSRHAGAVAFA